MITTEKNPIAQLTTLASGLFFGLVSVAAVVLLSGSPASSVQASSHCGGKNVCQNQSASFTINAVAKTVSIDTFNLSGQDINTTPNPPEIHFGDVNQGGASAEEIIWNTTNAQTITLTSTENNSSWSGTTTDEDGQETILDGAVAADTTYTYTLTAENAAGATTSTSTSLKVIPNPPTYNLELGANSVSLDGAPGSTATIEVSINTTNYDDNVNLYIGNDTNSSLDDNDIPEALKDDEDNALVGFTFRDDTLDSSDDDTILEMQVLKPIRTSASTTIQVTADATGTTTSQNPQTETFDINADGFSPRTIEEF